MSATSLIRHKQGSRTVIRSDLQCNFFALYCYRPVISTVSGPSSLIGEPEDSAPVTAK